MRPVFRLQCPERVEAALVLAGGQQPPLDAELLHALDETETIHEYPDRTDDGRLVGVYLVGRGHGVVTARGTDIGNHRVHRDLGMLLAQTHDLVVDIPRLHRTATGAVGADDDTDGVLAFERRAQTGDDVVRARLRIRGDGALDLHQRRMAAGKRLAAALADQ